MSGTGAEPAPEISVVIPAWGRPEELARALDALGEQRLPRERFEVVVVDDGSPESLEAVVAARGGRIPVRYLRHTRNRGRAAARNTGARDSRGERLLFLDADMIASPGLLEAHLVAEAARDRLVALGPIPVEPGFETVLGRYMEGRGHMRAGLDRADVPFRYYVSSNTSMSRALFDRVGGYDERFIYYGGEDIDMGTRLHAAGGRIVVAPEAVARHAYRYQVGPSARRMREFGRLTLPLVLERHPELRDVFHLDLVTSRGPLTAACFRLATLPPLLGAAAALSRPLGRVAPWILSYVLVGNYFRGYLQRPARRD